MWTLRLLGAQPTAINHNGLVESFRFGIHLTHDEAKSFGFSGAWVAYVGFGRR
jgi:hypothetical protein